MPVPLPLSPLHRCAGSARRNLAEQQDIQLPLLRMGWLVAIEIILIHLCPEIKFIIPRSKNHPAPDVSVGILMPDRRWSANGLNLNITMKIIRLRGKLKGIFFLLRSDLLIPRKIFEFFAWMAELSKWIHHHRHCEYSDFYTFRFNYAKREDLYEHVIRSQKLDEIDYLEFGVATGNSFRWWTSRMQNPSARFYGFDTFSGLPEDWGPFRKGDMNNGNKPPEIKDDRHTFYQGLFQQTLLPFLKEYKSDRRKVIHMDADLYTATLYVLTLLTPYLNPGDIVFFDEFNVPMHEFKAFREWTESFYIQYEVLGGVNNFYQVALKITSF